MKKYKVLFADLDGTLIKTKSGETFPKGIWDMEFRFEVWDAIKKMKPGFLFIVSNQGGIEKGLIDRYSFSYKIKYVSKAIKDYCDYLIVDDTFCASNDKKNMYRKPNTGMLWHLFNMHADGVAKVSDCLMIGDASGKEGQWSDTDRKTAENFGCDYLDVEDFVKLVNAEL